VVTDLLGEPHRVAVVEGAFGAEGDLVSFGKAGEDYGSGDARGAGLDGAPFDTAVAEQVDAGLAALGSNRFLRDRQAGGDHLRGDLYVDVGAGDELQVGVVDGRQGDADLPGADRSHLGGHLLDGPLPLASRQRVPGHGDRHSHADAAQFGFIHLNANLQFLYVANTGYRVAGIQERSLANGQIVDRPVHGGTNRAAFQLQPGLLQGGLGFVHLGPGRGTVGHVDQGNALLLQPGDNLLDPLDALAGVDQVLPGSGLFGGQALGDLVVALGGFEIQLVARDLIRDIDLRLRRSAVEDGFELGARFGQRSLARSHFRPRVPGGQLGDEVAFPHGLAPVDGQPLDQSRALGVDWGP